MKFAAAHWLWALLALIPLYIGIEWDRRRRQTRLGTFANPTLWKALAPELDWSAGIRKARVWTLALVFVILALARPQWGSREETVKVSGLDVMLVLDISSSMEVEDVVPSRLKKMKHLVRAMLEKLEGDRVGVVAFAASNYVASPLTTDLGYVGETVEILSPRLIQNQGTDIGSALGSALQALDRAAEEAPRGKNEPTTRVIILVSDGEDQEDLAIEAAKKIRETGQKLYVIGVGTEAGGPIPVREESGQLRGYKRDRKGQAVVSTFKPKALAELASASGGRFWPATVSEGEIDEILSDMGALNRTDFSERKYLIFEERYQIPLVIAVLLLLLELTLPARKILAGAALLFFILTPTAHANPVETYIKNEEGIRAFKEGRIEDAQKQFGTAQAIDPHSPELLFNQGVAQLKQGDNENAVHGFGEAAVQARLRKNPKLEGEALFNLGAALQAKGDERAATRAYASAISRAMEIEDKDLEEAARKNLRLMQAKKEKQQQEKKEEKDQKKDQQSKSGQGDSKNDQDKKDGKDQQKQKQYADNSKNGKRQFQSQKFSKDDAKRVMEELSGKEKELQARLKAKRGGPASPGKDW